MCECMRSGGNPVHSRVSIKHITAFVMYLSNLEQKYVAELKMKCLCGLSNHPECLLEVKKHNNSMQCYGTVCVSVCLPAANAQQERLRGGRRDKQCRLISSLFLSDNQPQSIIPQN